MPESVCIECGKAFTPVVKNTELCPKCLKKKAKQDKLDWIAERRWNTRENREATIEERVAWMEEWIYEHRELVAKKLLGDNIPF